MIVKTLLTLISLAFPLYTLADPGAIYDNMEESVMHETYHEPLHVRDKAAHEKGSIDFAKADKNKDEKLTKKEAKILPSVSKNFELIDADKDGTVDRDEIHIYMSNTNR